MAVSRVRRPKHFEKMLADMCQDPERRVFAAYKDALIFAACLGYAREKRVPFEGTSERVHLEAFTGPHDLDLVNVLALAETGDTRILSPERDEEKYLIFEEYACGGLEILKSAVYDQSDWEGSLLSLVSAQKQGDEKILEDIAGAF